MTVIRPNKDSAESRPLITIVRIGLIPKSHKGTLVELDGRTSASAWMNKDGELKSGLNFSASRIKLHSGGNKEISKQQPTSEAVKDNPFADEENDSFTILIIQNYGSTIQFSSKKQKQ